MNLKKSWCYRNASDPPIFATSSRTSWHVSLSFGCLRFSGKKIRSTCWKHQVRWQEFLSANRTELYPQGPKVGSQSAENSPSNYVSISLGFFFEGFDGSCCGGNKTTTFKELMNFNNPSKKTMYISKDGHLSLYKDKKNKLKNEMLTLLCFNIATYVFRLVSPIFSQHQRNLVHKEHPAPPSTQGTTLQLLECRWHRHLLPLNQPVPPPFGPGFVGGTNKKMRCGPHDWLVVPTCWRCDFSIFRNVNDPKQNR